MRIYFTAIAIIRPLSLPFLLINYFFDTDHPKRKTRTEVITEVTLKIAANVIKLLVP